MPSDLATFKIPMPFASCFRTLRSVVLSIFGHDEDHSGPDFGSRHARRNRPGFRTGPPVRMTSDTAGSASAAAAESLPSVRVFRPHDQPAALLVNSGTMEEAAEWASPMLAPQKRSPAGKTGQFIKEQTHGRLLNNPWSL